MKKTFLLLIMALACFVTSYGQGTITTSDKHADFLATDNFGNSCYYKIIDATNHYVKLLPNEIIRTTTYTYTSGGTLHTSASESYVGNESHFNQSNVKTGLPSSVVNPNTGIVYYVKKVGYLADSDLRMHQRDTLIISEGIEEFDESTAMMWTASRTNVLILPSTLKFERKSYATFRENWGLQKVIGLENTKLTIIPDYYFAQCNAITTNWVLPPTVKYIGERSLPFPQTQDYFVFPASVDTIHNSFMEDTYRTHQVKVFRSENPNPPTIFAPYGGRGMTAQNWKFLSEENNKGTSLGPDSIYVPVDVTAAYEAKQGWSSYIGKFFEEVKIGPHGYTSYYLENENFQVPAGCTAYIIKKVDHPAAGSVVGDAQVVAFAPGKIIPKQTGFILQGTAGKTIAYQANVSGVEENVTGNLLVGTATGQEFSGAGFKYYLFGYGIKGQGFYHQTGRNGESIKLPAHRAGLKVSLTGTDYAPAKELIFNFEEATTNGISSVAQTAEPRTDVIYDLQGRRVKNPVNGIYIVNGKKVVISK